jgi:hypothetical protein
MLTTEQYMQAEFDYSLAEARRGFKVQRRDLRDRYDWPHHLERPSVGVHGRRLPVGRLPARWVGIGLTFHYIDAYRREGRSIRDRQREMELRGTDEGTRLTVAGFQTRPQEYEEG